MRRPAPLHRAAMAVLAVSLLIVPPAVAATVRARVQSTKPDARAGSIGDAKADPVVSFVIPRGHTVTGIEAHAASTTAVGGAAAVPVAAALPLAEVTGVGAWYGYQIAFVRLHPVQARDGVIERAESVDLVLHTATGGELPLARERANPALAAREAALVRSQVANPDEVETFAPPAGRVVPKRGGFVPAAYPDLEGSDVEYVIVTSAALAPAFQSLADWKTKRGVPTVV